MNTKTKSGMGWSLHLGRWLGIDVYIHMTFLVLLAFIGLSQGIAAGSAGAAIGGVLFFAGLFVCVLLHEYGHALAACRYGIATRDITLLPIGGVARLERMPDKPWQEFVVALAGPAVNVVIAGGLTMVVIEDGRFVGLLTPENVGEFFMIRRALAERDPNRPPAPPVIPVSRGVPPPILARQAGA
jgi:stage IV sporulation protein FB